MPVKVFGPNDVRPLQLPGRELRRLAAPENAGTTLLLLNDMRVPPKVQVLPCHAHVKSEELIYVIDGVAEVWVDGETAVVRSGEVALFPVGSKHMVRNLQVTPLHAI